MSDFLDFEKYQSEKSAGRQREFEIKALSAVLSCFGQGARRFEGFAGFLRTYPDFPISLSARKELSACREDFIYGKHEGNLVWKTLMGEVETRDHARHGVVFRLRSETSGVLGVLHTWFAAPFVAGCVRICIPGSAGNGVILEKLSDFSQSLTASGWKP